MPVLLHTAYANTEQPAILVLGDSLSAAYGINAEQGWANLLQQRLATQGYRYHVVNASVSGDTTRTALNRLDDAIQQHKPAIIIVALGGNDGLRGLPFSEIEQSLSRIIEKSQQEGLAVLLAGVRLPPNYGTFYNTQFSELFQSLSKKYGLALVPRILDKVAGNSVLMQEDGMHPTSAGQKQILENVWPYLLPMLK